MERITANLTPSRLRRETLQGREYLVAPMTLIVPGVLKGSQGPLYYPAEEISREPEVWNGMPMVVYHPQTEGQNVSARDPVILESQHIGYVFHARSTSNGRLKAEGWFDVDRTRKVDARVLSALRRGQTIELSTGLFTDNAPAENDANYNGEPYTHVARNYRPDHLAILPDQVGACSVRDGCGVNVNGLTANIVRKLPNGKYRLYSHKGKNLGTFDSEEAAKKHEREVQFFKHNAAGQPHSKNTGKFKRLNAGTGKGESHEAAQRGAIRLSATEIALGSQVQAEKEAGHNPPAWVDDESAWDRAKELAEKGEYPEYSYWPVVVHIYQNITGGGGYKGPRQSARKYKASRDTATPGLSKSGKMKKNAGHKAPNVTFNLGEPNMAKALNGAERKKLIDHLIQNVCCWNEEDRELLEEFADEKLQKFVAQAAKDAQAGKTLEAVMNAAKEVSPKITANALPEFIKEKMAAKKRKDEECDPEVENCEEVEEEKPVAKNRRLTEKELLAALPAEMKEDLAFARNEKARRKVALINRLVGNMQGDQEQEMRKLLGEKPLTELAQLAALVPEKESDPVANYYGAAGGGVLNESGIDPDDILPLPTINFSREQKQA